MASFPFFHKTGIEQKTHFKTYLNDTFMYKNSYKQDK